MADQPRYVLRTEHRSNPLGIDVSQPRLSWTFESESPQRSRVQSAYQIIAATTRSGLDQNAPDLWDSQKIESSQTVDVRYRGKPLSSGQAVFWKLRIWEGVTAHEWSDPATFTMGLLERKDWQAKWIGPDTTLFNSKALPIFRRSFSVNKPIARATVFICGLGQFELHTNGKTVGENVLDPGWTDYKKTCLYITHDATALLQQGENVLGVMLGNGMYSVIGTPGRYKKFKSSFGPPKLIAQLHIEYTDGSFERVLSDESWRVSPGPITFSCIYGGEDYDARLEQQGWDSPGFNDSNWQAVAIVDAPAGKLISQSAPPIKAIEQLSGKQIESASLGPVYDLSRNISGWPTITASAQEGVAIKVVPGELLDAEGNVSQRSSGSPMWFHFTTSKAQQTWKPRFSYTGFRYLQVVEGASAVQSIGAEFIHSSAPMVGNFRCSSQLFNQIHGLINAAILSNLQSVLTDCPHREKLGWLEQSHLMGEAIMFNYDVQMLYAKICADMRDAQQPDGCVPTIAPEYTQFKGNHGDFSNSPEWGSAAVINPWLVYQQYGDRKILEDNYDLMKRYVDYLHSREEAGIISFGLADWYDIGPGDPGYSKLTSKALTGTAIYFRDLTILQQTAELLGDHAGAAQSASRAEHVRTAFTRDLFHPETGQYDKGSQTANAMALAMGLVDPKNRAAVLANLISDIRTHNNHITAGDIGFRFVLEGLAANDRSDVIYDLLSQTDAPSYGNQLRKGATTLTEAWDANPKNSQNHLMLGHAELWFYQHLAGVRVDLSQPIPITIQPAIVGDIEWAEATYQSTLGEIASRWEIHSNKLKLSVQIPFNASATIHVPNTDANSIFENGKPFSQSPGVRFVQSIEKHVIFEVGSGSFVIELTVRDS